MVLKKHELLEVIKKELYTPVVGDILDQMGLYHQFLPQAVRPLREDMKLAGYPEVPCAARIGESF